MHQRLAAERGPVRAPLRRDGRQPPARARRNRRSSGQQRPARTSPPRAPSGAGKPSQRRRAVDTVMRQGCHAARRAHVRRLRRSGCACADTERLKARGAVRAHLVPSRTPEKQPRPARTAPAGPARAPRRTSGAPQREQPAGVAAVRAAEAPVETAARSPMDSALASARLEGCRQRHCVRRRPSRATQERPRPRGQCNALCRAGGARPETPSGF